MQRERLPAGFAGRKQRKRTPAETAPVERCVYFTLYCKNGPGDKHVLRCASLAAARAARPGFQAAHCRGGRQAAIYGVDQNGLTHFVE